MISVSNLVAVRACAPLITDRSDRLDRQAIFHFRGGGQLAAFFHAGNQHGCRLARAA